MFEKLNKTIKIPIRINKGKVGFFFGGEMLEIKDGTMGELILPEYSIKNKEMIKKLQETYTVELFKADSELLLSVYKKFLPANKEDLILNITNAYPQMSVTFIKVVLEESLYLQFRGSKHATLLNVKCKIPCLDNKEATSINNAYMLMSQELEPTRKSHTGNMFEKCYYEVHDNTNNCKYWLRLWELREKYEIEYERDLFLDSQVFKLNDRFNGEAAFTEDEMLLINKIIEFDDISGLEIKKLFSFNRDKYFKIVDNLLESKYICEKSL